MELPIPCGWPDPDLFLGALGLTGRVPIAAGEVGDLRLTGPLRRDDSLSLPVPP